MLLYLQKWQGSDTHDTLSIWLPKQDKKNDSTNGCANMDHETSFLDKELQAGKEYWKTELVFYEVESPIDYPV